MAVRRIDCTDITISISLSIDLLNMYNAKFLYHSLAPDNVVMGLDIDMVVDDHLIHIHVRGKKIESVFAAIDDIQRVIHPILKLINRV